MLVGRIAPAPSVSHCFAHATASFPTGLVPPETTSAKPDGIAWFRRASTAMVIFSFPNFNAASATRAGRATAALFMETLSAPASRVRRMSSSDPIPPPTVSGMSMTAETARTHSSRVLRFSSVAAMSSIASSSAPSFW